ncbi:unnamed protein product [Orchesella dallaii]|uniref:Uncharacterized protein n=1 Tax=Orchesella dallaii TaxID=48710 RepID=A0ABP1QP89_9HEXA
MKSIVLLLVLGCAFSAIAIELKPENKLTSLKSLSPIQKFGVFAASNLMKKDTIAKTLSGSDLFDETSVLPIIDFFYADFRALLVQAIKVTEEPALPELDWSYKVDICIIFWCFDLTLTLTTAETIILGQKQISSVNEVTPNSFTNRFHVPHLQWHSLKFLFNITDHEVNEQHLNEDLYVALHNLTIVTSANYEYVPELGVQVRNLSIDFSLGYFRSNIENISIVRADGSVEISDPIKSDVTEDVVQTWIDYKEEYELSLQFRTNCLLSAFRSDPRCVYDGDYDEADFNRAYEYIAENILQLFGTVVLGSMDRR